MKQYLKTEGGVRWVWDEDGRSGIWSGICEEEWKMGGWEVNVAIGRGWMGYGMIEGMKSGNCWSGIVVYVKRIG